MKHIRKVILLISILLMMTMLISAIGLTTRYNPWTGKADFIANGNFSDINVTADNFFGDGSNLENMPWNRNETNVFLSNSGDFVGIGTTNPSSLLTLVGTDADITINATGSTDPVIRFISDADSEWMMGMDENDDDSFSIVRGGVLNNTISAFSIRSTDDIQVRGGVRLGNDRQMNWRNRADNDDLQAFKVNSNNNFIFNSANDLGGIFFDNTPTKIIHFRHGDNTDAISISDGVVTINEDSGDVNFRVETNNSDYAFFVDGTNDNIGMGGVTAPSERLHITGNLFLGNDDDKIILGAGKDVSTQFTGTDWNFTAEVGAPNMNFDMGGGNYSFLNGDFDVQGATGSKGTTVELFSNADANIGAGVDYPRFNIYGWAYDFGTPAQKYASMYINSYGKFVIDGDNLGQKDLLFTNFDDVQVSDNVGFTFGTGSGDYKFYYDNSPAQFQLWSTNIDGIGTNGNIFEVDDGTDDVNFLGNLNITGNYIQGANVGFTGDCVNTTYSGGIAISCND